MSLLFEATDGGGQLEGPQEVIGFLEVRADGPDFVDKVLNAGDTEFAKDLLDDRVVVYGNSGAVNLSVTSSVDELLDGGSGGVAVGNQGFNVSNHVHGGLVQSYENTVVELAESEKLQDLLLFGGELVDTTDSDNKGDLGLTFNEEVASFFGCSLCVDECFVSCCVLFGVLFSVGSLGLSCFSALLLCRVTGSLVGGQDLCITCGLL